MKTLAEKIAFEEEAFDTLRDLQNFTQEGSSIIDEQGQVWIKDERNWWFSNSGWEVTASFFFDYGIKVKDITAEVRLWD